MATKRKIKGKAKGKAKGKPAKAREGKGAPAKRSQKPTKARKGKGAPSPRGKGKRDKGRRKARSKAPPLKAVWEWMFEPALDPYPPDEPPDLTATESPPVFVGSENPWDMFRRLLEQSRPTIALDFQDARHLDPFKDRLFVRTLSCARYEEAESEDVHVSARRWLDTFMIGEDTETDFTYSANLYTDGWRLLEAVDGYINSGIPVALHISEPGEFAALRHSGLLKAQSFYEREKNRTERYNKHGPYPKPKE